MEEASLEGLGFSVKASFYLDLHTLPRFCDCTSFLYIEDNRHKARYTQKRVGMSWVKGSRHCHVDPEP